MPDLHPCLQYAKIHLNFKLQLHVSLQPNPKSEVRVRVLKQMWCWTVCMSLHTGAMHSWQALNQGCTNLRCHAAQPTKFCTVAPNVCGSSVWHLLHVTILVSRILRWFLDFTLIFACQCHSSSVPHSHLFHLLWMLHNLSNYQCC